MGAHPQANPGLSPQEWLSHFLYMPQIRLYEDVGRRCYIYDKRWFNESGRSMLEDRYLILRFNRGDRGVLHRIYDKYRDDLATLAAALLLDVSLADDVVHDVFIAFIDYAGPFRLTGSLKGYLMTCVANRARNVNKAAWRRHGTTLDNLSERACEAPLPEQTAIFGEEFRRLAEALWRLPYEQREVLLLRSHSRLRFAAIAKAQGVSINTVQGRYRYAVTKLRSLLDSEANE
jgi:RNA polymerase sigma-70 factor, ECF subfamily